MTNKKDVKTVAVIGAGIMGRGIAHVSIMGGFTTVLNDVSDDLLRKAQDNIRKDLQKGIDIGKVTSSEVEQSLARLTLESSVERAVNGADAVIEAIPEQIDLKLELFARLDRACPPHVMFASNTSALSITEMAGATK